MELAIIVAAAENHVIGRDNGLIWHLSADLKRFKALTTGHAILMGRKTFESMGRALPNRRNVVISGNPGFVAPGYPESFGTAKRGRTGICDRRRLDLPRILG